jgi:hypothetical protein
MTIPQTHHGIHVTDIEQTKAVLRKLGYTETQPGAPEPLELRNVPEDPVGQQTAHALGDRYVTHYIENPATGHQIDLIEIGAQWLSPRLTREPMQGDLTMGIHFDDPLAAYETMRANDPRGGYSDPVDCPEEDGIRFFGVEGQEFIFTRHPDPFAIVYYNERYFPTARRFYEDVLGFAIVELDSPRPHARRYRLLGVGGRIDFEVRADVAVPDYATMGKHYQAANHFRLLNADLERVAARSAETRLGGFLLGPYPNGFSFMYGPTNETPEVYDMAMWARAMESERAAAAPA